MEILSGFDLTVKKKTAKNPDTGSWMSLMLPTQFVEDKAKDLPWAAQSMNFIESQGILQLRRNLNWMSRNYQLRNNIIDKRDYIRDKDNEYFELVNRLTDENSAMELRAVPFIQLIINSLVNEFSKRPSKIAFNLLDDKSMDEMFADKESDIEQILLAQCAMKQQNKMQEMGITADSEQGKQMMDPNTIKSLPAIQDFYNHSYRSMYQEWAEHRMIIDNDRFYFDEMKRMCFDDSLTVDRAFLHLYMKEDDYETQRWNPKTVFYRKSPDERWIQNGQWVGKLSLLTVPDTLDMYGWMMTEDQQLMLNRFYPAKSAAYAIDGRRPDEMWDTSQSYDYNRTGPGIASRQVFGVLGLNADGTGDITNQLFADSEDIIDTTWTQLIRVCTIYWKTQRHVYELTSIDEDGNMKRDLVSDSYVVVNKPVYNTLVYKEKSADNLVFGDHLDGIWINEVWGGIKIGPNLPVYGWSGQGNNFSPMYLGIRGKRPSRLPYQFRKKEEKWKPLLPVCGSVFNDYVHSRSLVDTLKLYQIGVNMTANQILDLMVDELGVIIQMDPTAFPKHSMGEDWGPDPFPKAIQVMRDFSIIPVTKQMSEDGRLTNPEHAVKVLDASQSTRFVTKMKLHQFFMEQGLNAVGMNPRRLGQPIDTEDTATGVEQSQSASYSSTEHLFTQFDDLLVRFHKMRTDCAQYYNSTNPSVRLQYATSSGMKQWFMMDGRNLDSRDLGIQCISSPHSRNVLEEIKRMILKNNTSNMEMTDIIRLAAVDVLADLPAVIKSIEQKQQQQAQQKQQQEQDTQKAEQDHEMQIQQNELQNTNDQNQADRENKLEVAQIMISPKLANESAIEDTTGKLMHEQLLHADKMDLERQRESNKSIAEQQKVQLGNKKLQSEDKRTDTSLKIARLNNKKPETKKK